MNLPDLRALVEQAPPEELPRIVGQLREAELLAELRLRRCEARPHGAGDDRNLSAKEAARRLGVSLPYLYKHAAEYPFTRYIGKRVLFSAMELDAWNQGQRPPLSGGRLDG